MASNYLLIVLLVLVSIYVTSAYTLSTRDVVLKKYDDESYSRVSSEQVSSMINQAKARSLQALVVVNKASRSKSRIKTKRKVGSLDVLTFVGIIILAIIVIIVIIGLLLGLCRRLETKKTQSIRQGEVGAKETGHETDEKMETVTMSSISVANV